MRKLLNTLFVTKKNVYLSLDGDNVVLLQENNLIGRLPLHNIESIVTFGYTGASPALMGYCADKNISITFLTKRGRYLARVIGKSRGNVVLRKKQYRISDCERSSAVIARNFLIGKVFNQKWIIERMIRDHSLRINVNDFKETSNQLTKIIKSIRGTKELEMLRGLEGRAAVKYYQLLNDMILQQEGDFSFEKRTRRPPLDRVNALLSFGYTLLANDMASALESVGLDAYVGFLHRDRPGRPSLALDVMEELRSISVDRFVLTLINTKIIRKEHFLTKENRAVLLTDEGRRIFLEAWHKKKQEKIKHPYLQKSIPWGLVPYAQSLLLARFLRNDLDEYPTFLWK